METASAPAAAVVEANPAPANCHVASLVAYRALSMKSRVATTAKFIETHYETTVNGPGKKDTHKCKYCKVAFIGSQIRTLRHFLSRKSQLTFTTEANLVVVCDKLHASAEEFPDLPRAVHYAEIVRAATAFQVPKPDDDAAAADCTRGGGGGGGSAGSMPSTPDAST